ncbi:PAS domain S-box protein [Breoghania sp. L-A4]|uniref:PAS domain S-box protein n=1 Tax=Breoghania sp. L-A4 TaxID=2304600 RepID=UPI000E35C671|nr:PAS domain S-box protein [Breoghania sp. L-A4]AXS40220.1 PAS domain S-box protein [Breoghania sp. L-A4]
MRTADGPVEYRPGRARTRRGVIIPLVLAAAAMAIILGVLAGGVDGALAQDASVIADGQPAGSGSPEHRYEDFRATALMAFVGLVALVIVKTLIIVVLALRHRRVLHDFKRLAAMESARGAEIAEAHRQTSEREAELRAVLDNMINGVLTIDARGCVLSCNPAAERLLGYAAADLMRLDIRALFCDSDGESLSDFIADESGGRPDTRHGEFTGITSCGRTVPLDVSLSRMYLAGRRQFVLILRDLSARKSALARIDEVENRLINAINALPDGFVLYDQDDRMIMCNNKYREIYSRSSDFILVGRKFEDMLREGVRRGQYAHAKQDPETWILERLRQHSESGSVVEQELANGRWLRIFEQPTPEGGTVGFRVDITELKQREMALRQSENLLRATVFGAFDGIIVVNDCGVIVSFNPAAESIFGYSEQDACGANVFDLLLVEPLRSRYVLGLENYKATGYGAMLKRRTEVECRRKDGTMVLVEASVNVSEGVGERLFIANVRDIAEEKARALALEDARDKAEVASQAKASFLAMMSHEIRTPLNGVLGLLELLAETALDDKQIAYVDTAGESAQALLAIIDDVLVFSKMEAGKFDLEPEPGSLRRLLEGVGSLMAPRADARGLTLRISIAEATPDLVLVDMGRLRQVLLNLVGNALKFTETGTVSMELSRVGARDARGANEGVHRIRFAVRDTGIGIPGDKIPDLFEEFSTLERSYSRRYEGTGLGLAICRELVSRMGGRITVESVLGEGSLFYFELPLREAPAPPPRAQARVVDDAVLSRVRGARILLTEDNATNRMVLSEMLAGVGCTVHCANTGREAVDMVRALTFDAVLMDISMPEMDGEEATRLVRAMAAPVGDVPIIALTAHALAVDRDRILANGMDAFLSKPVSKQELVTTLAALLETGRRRNSAMDPSAARETTDARLPQAQQDVLARPDMDSGVIRRQRDPAGGGRIEAGTGAVEAIKERVMAANAGLFPATAVEPDVLSTLLSGLPQQMRGRVLAQFDADTRERLAQLSDATARGDLASIGAATHALTSLLGTFGAMEASKMSAEIDHQVRLGAQIDELDLVYELLDHAEAAISAITGYGEQEYGAAPVVPTTTGDR